MTAQRQRLLWTAAGVVLIVLLAGAGIALANRAQSRPSVAASTPTVTAPGASTSPSDPAPPAGADITGPLNLLIVGLDTRVSVSDWQPHSDAIMLLHVPAGLDSGYLFSLPRDLLVDVPAFPPSGFGGGRIKITEAMSRGAKVPGTKRPDVRQGYELLSRTISAYTGIDTIDAGALLTFDGMRKLTDALGGVTLKIDQKVVSRTNQPDGKHRRLRPGGDGYVGPQAVYLPGTRRLVGWQALDYARQRYTAGGDYTRQRHQRQLIKALLSEADDAGLATDPAKLQAVVAALGDTLVFAGDRTPVDYAYALRNLRPSALTLVGLPGASVIRGGRYRGEQLTQVGRDFLEALADGEADTFLRTHPKLVNKS
jgi:LCP family protein required for cell wall assembly